MIAIHRTNALFKYIKYIKIINDSLVQDVPENEVECKC